MEDIIDTLDLQVTSVVLFAARLGFFLDRTSAGGLLFENDKGIKAKFPTMKHYHNGGSNIDPWSSLSDVLRDMQLRLKLSQSYEVCHLKYNYENRLIKICKVNYSDKKKGFIPLIKGENIVKVCKTINNFEQFSEELIPVVFTMQEVDLVYKNSGDFLAKMYTKLLLMQERLT